MLIVTVEKLPHDSIDGRRLLGEARIVNIGGDAGLGAYSVHVLDYTGNTIARGELTDHPLLASATAWDLAIRALTVALSGINRQVYGWNQGIKPA